MKIFNIKILALCFIIFLAVNANAYQAGHPPLMVIRYNKPQISYTGKLFYAISEAVKTKPSVIFDVVAYAPSNYYGAENAQYYGQKVVDDIIKIGVNPQQVTFSTQYDSRLKNEEVKIFVR